MTDRSDWREVTITEVCPVCGKPDWCSLTGPEGAGEAAVCMRIASSNQRPNGGWLHRLRESHNWQTSRNHKGSGVSPGNGKPHVEAPTFAKLIDAVVYWESRLDKHTGLWTYHNAAGESVGAAVRFDTNDGKTIRPVSLNSDGRWTLSGMPNPRPLYNLPELANTHQIFIVEGEKCVEALRSIGLVATTSASGSSAANQTDWKPMAGKHIVVLPDNDRAGEKYASDVVAILATVTPAPSVRVVQLDKHIDGTPMPTKGDVADWIDGHGDAATTNAIVENLMRLVNNAAVVEVELDEPAEPALQWQPFPVEELPEPLASFVLSVARSIQVDNAMVALPALCASAAAIGASRSISLRADWQEPCIIWGALVAPSGEGKTPAAGKVLSSARQRDAEAQEENGERQTEYEEKYRDYQATCKAWDKQRSSNKSTDEIGPAPTEPDLPKLPRVTVGDITIERLKEILADSPRGLLMIRDELTGMLGGFDKYSGGRSGSERSTYLSLHNAEPDQNDRKVDNRRSVTLKNPHLSIYGGIQPDLLHRVLSNDDVAAGLPARFLFSMPSTTPKTWGTPAIPNKHHDNVALMFSDLYAIGVPTDWTPDQRERNPDDLEQTTLELTPEADRRFGEFYVACHVQRSDLHGPVQAAWPKLIAYCGRLALIVQLIRDPDSTEVDDDSMQRAIMLIKWFSNEALRIYSLRTESDDERQNRELVAWIRGKGGAVTVRDLSRGPRQYRKAGVADAALNQLAAAGLGSWKLLSTGTNKKRVFILVTAATATDSPETAGLAECVTVASITAPPEC